MPTEHADTWKLQDFTSEQPQLYTFTLDTHFTRSGFEPVKVEQVVSYDSFHRPVYALGNHGEQIYYSYVYDKTTRLSVFQGKVVEVQIDKTEYPGRRKRQAQIVLFGQQGRTGFLKRTRNSRVREVIYEEITPENKVAVQVHLAYDTKGNLTYNSWRESEIKEPIESSFDKKQRANTWINGQRLTMSHFEEKIRQTGREDLQTKLKQWLFSWDK